MSELDELREVQTASREIFDGRIMHVFEDTVRLPDGNAATREYMRHIGAVCVIPVLENGDVLVERQYRYPVGQVLTEIPAGKLDRRDEDRLLAAQRELREETGAEAGEWTSLGLFYPACAYSDEAIEMFLARGIRFGERHLDKDEFLKCGAHAAGSASGGGHGRRGAGRKDADRRFEGGAPARAALSTAAHATEIGRHIQIT